jgi:hypothetical protein
VAAFGEPRSDVADALGSRFRAATRISRLPARALLSAGRRSTRCVRNAYCKRCHPGAIERRWTHERVLVAMTEWRSRYGTLPSSYDWSRTHAGRRGGEALKRLAEGEWPASSVVTRLFGTWAVARAAASRPNVEVPTSRPSAKSRLGRNSFSLTNPRESTAKSEDLRGGGAEPQHYDSRAFPSEVRISPIIRVGGVPGSNPGAPIETCKRSVPGIASLSASIATPSRCASGPAVMLCPLAFHGWGR